MSRSELAPSEGSPAVRKEPTLLSPSSGDSPATPADRSAAALQQLRDTVERFGDAMRSEGIDSKGVLGVWSDALRAGLISFVYAVEVLTERVEGQSLTVQGAMNAAVARVDIEVDRVRAVSSAAHAEMVLSRQKMRESEEVRKVENLTLARELGTEISETVKTTALAREIRFNRRQNWSAVALVAVIFLSVFIGGAVWASYRSDHAILGACLKAQRTDPSGKVSWCPMTVVQGSA